MALRENGDVVRAINEGNLREADLVTMKELLGEAGVGKKTTGAPISPSVIIIVGISWQDLVVAAAIAKV